MSGENDRNRKKKKYSIYFVIGSRVENREMRGTRTRRGDATVVCEGFSKRMPTEKG